MRLLSLTAILAGTSTLCAVMAIADTTPETEIKSVISGQLEAFQADDFETAFGFASPSIRNMFGDSGNFGAMVKRGYPMVWRHDDVRYFGLRQGNGMMTQRVMIRAQDGQIHFLDYHMVQRGTGSGWQINGVELVQDDVGA